MGGILLVRDRATPTRQGSALAAAKRKEVASFSKLLPDAPGRRDRREVYSPGNSCTTAQIQPVA